VEDLHLPFMSHWNDFWKFKLGLGANTVIFGGGMIKIYCTFLYIKICVSELHQFTQYENEN